MRMVPVLSSNLAAVGYDPLTAELRVLFNGGALYAYYGVSPGVHAGLMAAASKGSYLHQVIRDRYPYKRIG